MCRSVSTIDDLVPQYLLVTSDNEKIWQPAEARL
jgi:hypothetical protein